MNATHAARKEGWSPWDVPESLTIYEYAPADIRDMMHPHWQTQKAVHPLWYYTLGLYFVLIGAVAIIGNIMVLRLFGTFAALRSPSNLLVMNLAVSDLLLMGSLVPELVYNFFSGGPWRFGNMACQIHAFCGAIFGYSQITTLILISWDRYKVIVHGILAEPLSYCKAIGLCFASWVWSLGWALAPLIGWGLYSMDGMMATCSFDPLTQTLNNKTHILAGCLAFYVLPLISITGCYFFIVKSVLQHENQMRNQAQKMNVASLRAGNDMQARSTEIRLAKIALFNVTLWFLSWTPFAVLNVTGTWISSAWITPLAAELPVLLAKASSAYNPIVYALSHPKYRKLLKTQHPWMCIVLDSEHMATNDDPSTGSSSNMPSAIC